MTKIKEQAIEILLDIPDDKVFYLIEILKGLRALYTQNKKRTIHDITPSDILGICKQYANPKLIHLEKEAWCEAVKEKHAIN